MFCHPTLDNGHGFDRGSMLDGWQAGGSGRAVPAIRQRPAAAAILSTAGSLLSQASTSFGLPQFWAAELQENVRHLSEMIEGWDGPGSLPPSNHALFLAESYVREALGGCGDVTAPYLVPAGDGSVQIEWHERDGEIELSIEPDGELHLWGRDHGSGYEFTAVGADALAAFRHWAPRIAAKPRDGVDVPLQAETLLSEAA